MCTGFAGRVGVADGVDFDALADAEEAPLPVELGPATELDLALPPPPEHADSSRAAVNSRPTRAANRRA
jgi:hypothetical protein